MNDPSPDEPTTERLARLEAAQAAALQISALAAREGSLSALCATVHATVSRLMPAGSFHVGLYDSALRGVRYVYWADEKDAPPDRRREFPVRNPHESATAEVILGGQMRSFTGPEWAQRRAKGSRWGVGKRPEHWLGIPLLGFDGHTLGILVVQSYARGFRYGDEDMALLRMAAEQLAAAVERSQHAVRLEQAIAERTHRLEREVEERRRAERLQRALYEISAISVKDIDLARFYPEVHRILGGLLNARNFAVMLYYNDEHDLVGFPYWVDEKNPDLPANLRRPAGHGLTGFVLRTRMPQRIDQQRYQALSDAGVVHHVLGPTDFTVWIGAPMLHQGKVLGVLMLQSYDPKIDYDDDDLAVLTFVAEHIAAMLARKQADDALRTAHAHLATGNAALQEKNRELEMTLTHLGMAQTELVRQEKLASLGALVAGIAHEVNTPLGICTTAVSLLLEECKRLRDSLSPAQLAEPGIKAFFDSSDELLGVLTSNTLRASGLIRSFKQVAVDQSSEQVREIALAEYIEDTLRSLRPKFKRTGHSIRVQCDPGLRLRSIPGALAQILTNLVMNSIAHGFENTDQGHIEITATADDAGVTLDYRDDGAGMAPHALRRLFEPFYTTKRGHGGSGLGANIVHNLVTAKLGGTIAVDSQPGRGLHYAIHLPTDPPAPALR